MYVHKEHDLMCFNWKTVYLELKTKLSLLMIIFHKTPIQV